MPRLLTASTFRFALVLLASAASAQSDAIRLNQVGFYPDGPKVAVVVGAGAGSFAVRPAAGGAAVFTGTLGAAETWSPSGETVRLADFSGLATPGDYVVEAGGGTSHAFRVGDRALDGVARGALKGFYFQRASTALDAAHAGAWARAAGHPDDRVLVHASAATASRPAGTVLSAPGGWYDAGDYNKYVVNSGISTGTLLLLLEQYPDYAAALDAGIPESGDAVPDLLDEALWNLRWMRAMQDEDGGVYHKLTTANFSGAVLPAAATATRYVVQKGTAATLDFAAVMAQASRVLSAYEASFPGLAGDYREAALRAWAWARANPSVRYSQSALNAAFNPDIQTGEYGDGTFSDEFDWAAWELFLTTRADSFLTIRPVPASPSLGTPWWGSVREMGVFSLLTHRDEIGASVNVQALENALVGLADWYVSLKDGSAYDVVMGGQSWMWGWGSNSAAANQGVVLMQAYRLTGDAATLDAATANLDYLLGRNAMGLSFLTGFGEKTPLHIHHRPSEADGVTAPVPGLLAGGPNPGQEDGCAYPVARGTLPARSYVDAWCSYASNEIAINWNAPMVYLAAAVEAERSPDGLPTSADAPPEAGVDLGLGPNPTRGPATLRLGLAAPAPVTVRVFDTLGREVARPLDGAVVGDRAVSVGGGLPAGVYVVRVETPTGAASRLLTLVR